MAVYAAHLTRTLSGTPSVFQIVAQEALGATVKPALRKVIEYLAEVYPNKCGWCLHWFDELYLLFDCCLQYHYLKHYAASFSESFYGLLRVPISVSNEFASGQRLPDRLEKGSLLFLVLVPYLLDKVERIVDRWREDHEDGRLGKTTPDCLRRAATRVYGILHVVTSGARGVQLARYAAGSAASPTPALAALGLALRPAPPRDGDEGAWRVFWDSLRAGRFSTATVTFPMLSRVAGRGAEYVAFCVQLLRWWERRAPAAPRAVPPPPQKDESSRRWRNRCPLCLQTWKIPTVLPVSGYIFCYVCISRHVRHSRACPVTRCPATDADLVRLYID